MRSGWIPGVSPSGSNIRAGVRDAGARIQRSMPFQTAPLPEPPPPPPPPAAPMPAATHGFGLRAPAPPAPALAVARVVARDRHRGAVA